jgi:putative DNA primase/helicase
MSAAEPPRVSHLTLLQKPPPPFSDEALALRFAERHKDDLRYVDKTCQWFEWDGTRWKRDFTLRAIDLAREICREASAECNHPTEKKTIASARTVHAVEKLARADRQLAAVVDQWDRDAWLLNTPAGTVDLRTGRMLEHRREDYCTRIAPVPPLPGCPRFMKFLHRVTAGDEAFIRYLARVAGYALTGDTSEQCLFFLYGQGCNGKSVLVGALCEALGDYAHTSEAETFLSSKNDRHPTELARLADARLVIANEADADRQWNEARLKKLTGGDRMSARFMRQDEFEFTPQLKLMIVGNHKPSFRGVNYAIRRRLQLIPFNVTIPQEEVDKSLPEALREELGGILQWMIDGCLDWKREGLSPPRDVTEATEHYLNQEDTFGQWVNEGCERVPGAFTATAELRRSWTVFAESVGEPQMGEKAFAKEMEARGFAPKRTNAARGYEGVKLKGKGP